MDNVFNKKPCRNLTPIEKAAIDNTMSELLDLAGTDDETVEVIREELEEQFSKRSVELPRDEAVELARRLFNLSIKAVFSLMETENIRDWDIEKRRFFEENVPIEIEPTMKNWHLLEEQDKRNLVNHIYGGGIKEMRNTFIVAKVQISREYRGDEADKYVRYLVDELISLGMYEIIDHDVVIDKMLSATRNFYGDIYGHLLGTVVYKKKK